MGMDEAQARAWEELRRRLAAQVEALFDGDEEALAKSFMAALAPGDAQEQALALQMALTHLLALERIGAAREAELSEKPQWIEMGLAARFLSLHQRESASLDRHRAVRAQAEKRAQKRTADWPMSDADWARSGADDQSDGGFLVVPGTMSPEDWSREVQAHHARLMAGEPIPPEQREAWAARCRRAVDAARARGQRDGVVVVSEEEERLERLGAGPAPGDGRRGQP